MKREIEFRMWNCVKGNPSDSRMFYDTTEVMECLKQQMLFDSGNKVLGYDHVGDGNAFMQYTGLKDRNGVKVYEGDKVRCDYGLAKVVFHSGCFMVEWLSDPEANMEFLFSRKGFYKRQNEDEFEVTGNIHESGGGEG